MIILGLSSGSAYEEQKKAFKQVLADVQSSIRQQKEIMEEHVAQEGPDLK